MMNSVFQTIRQHITNLSDSDKISELNRIKQFLHEISPFCNEPVDCVLWIPVSQVKANDYNPNVMAPPEKKLLQYSIDTDGFTQPVVLHDEGDGYKIVDGFHRFQVSKKRTPEKMSEYIPVSFVRNKTGDKSHCIASTIRHNRARGKHQITPMSDIVRELHYLGWADEKISQELGMDSDEVIRLRQISGITEVFSGENFSEAWTVS
ncbi:IbrB-like domain-containing protein [Hafnia paralvei]|uniref:IbrB-like domain-containing protein n=1 Tax=Hafnia paralvei TaxID=546367 RepID=UPI001033037A|nr:ParB/RepB/Spo0J family partition protein [Hafnia paralvei]TBL57378.1 hypothetical protein EYY97_18065 [Hafnia paralvei]